MTSKPTAWGRPLLAIAAAVLLVVSTAIAAAQFQMPVTPPRTDVYERWAEVVSVTPKWLVLRDEQGKQYPVAVEAIGLFVTRWPTTLDRIAPTALVEATGVDVQSNRMLTDHLDVYEGAARNLVVPGLVMISGSGRGWRPIDFTFNADVYGDPFPGLGSPIQGGVNTTPARMHIVGPLVSKNPVMIGWEGNNALGIVGGPAGVSLSQITPGSIRDVRPGDLVYFAAVDARPKSLVLEQLVVYKAMPIDQFLR
jgi:hypothetical protein